MDLNSFLQLINSCLYHQDSSVRNQSTQTFFQLMEQDPISFLQFIILSLQSANTTQEQREVVSIIIRKHIYQYHVNSVVMKAIAQQRGDLAISLLETLLKLMADNYGSSHVYADSAAEVLCHIMSESPQAIQMAFHYLDIVFESIVPKVRHAGGHIVQMLFDCGFDKNMELNQQILAYLSILMESDDMKLNKCAVQGICNLLSATEYRDIVMENEYELKNDIVTKLLKLIEIMSSKIMQDQSQSQTYIETMGHICDTLYIILGMQDEAVSLLLNLAAALFDSQNLSFQKLGIRFLKEFCSTNEDRVVYDDAEVEQLIVLSIKMFTMLEIFDEHELNDILTAEDPLQLFQDQSIQSIIQEAIYEGRDRFNDVIIPALRKFCDLQSQQPEFHQVAITLVVLSILSQREQLLFDQNEIFQYIQISFNSENQLVLYYSILALQQLAELFSCDSKFITEVISLIQDRCINIFLKYNQISYIIAEIMNLYGKIIYSLTPNQSKDILDQSYQAVISTIENQSLFVQTARMTLLEFIIEKFSFKIQLQFVQLELSRDFQLVHQYGASLSQQLNKTQQNFFIQLLHCTSYLISCYCKQNILQVSQIEQLCSFVFQLCISQLADLQHEYRDVCMFAINVLLDDFAACFVNVIPQLMDMFFQILSVDSFGKQESITGESHYLRHIEDQKKDIYQICKKFIVKQPQLMLYYSNNLRTIICKDTAFWFGRSPQLEVLCELPKLFIFHNQPRTDITNCVQQVVLLLQQKVQNSKTFCSCEDVSALISCLQSLICITDFEIMQKLAELFAQLIQFLYENYSRRLTEAKEESQTNNNLNLIRQISLDIRQSNEECGIQFYGYCKLLLAETQNIQLLSILDQKINMQVSQILPYKSCTTRILCKHAEYQHQTTDLIKIKMQIYAKKGISYSIDVLLFIDILESIDPALMQQIYDSAKAKHHLQDLVLALKIAFKTQNQDINAISDSLVKAQETMNDHIYTVLFNTLQSLETTESIILTRIVSILLNFNIGVKQDQSDMQVLISLLPKCDQQLLSTLLTQRALQTMQQFQQ